MRSIASHRKEQFNEQEPFLESELSNVGKGEGFSELDAVASEEPGGDRCLIAREEVSLILRQTRLDEELRNRIQVCTKQNNWGP
jgi:hypothetical protein